MDPPRLGGEFILDHGGEGSYFSAQAHSAEIQCATQACRMHGGESESERKKNCSNKICHPQNKTEHSQFQRIHYQEVPGSYNFPCSCTDTLQRGGGRGAISALNKYKGNCLCCGLILVYACNSTPLPKSLQIYTSMCGPIKGSVMPSARMA